MPSLQGKARNKSLGKQIAEYDGNIGMHESSRENTVKAGKDVGQT